MMTDAPPFNFAAGPAVMPPEVLGRVREQLLDWNGAGMSVLEMPFTGPEFGEIMESAVADLRSLMGIPWNYHVLLMQGGASAQFSLVPMNLLGRRRHADYVETGHWSRRAANEARNYCAVNVAASGASFGYTRLPGRPAEWSLDPEAAYCHLTTNETTEGLQFHWLPDTGEVPLVADMTSDFLTRPVDVSRFGLIYASAQKNVAPAGLTLVIVRDDLLGAARKGTPRVFDYTRQAEAASKVNTPPTFSVYVAGLVFQWIRDQGGLAEMERRARAKSERLYAAIDASRLFRSSVVPEDRSMVTVCFSLPNRTLEREFLVRAKARGLLNLEGHAAAGGLRASLYNALPMEAVEALVGFMAEFEAHSAAELVPAQ